MDRYVYDRAPLKADVQVVCGFRRVSAEASLIKCVVAFCVDGAGGTRGRRRSLCEGGRRVMRVGSGTASGAAGVTSDG